MPEPIHVVIYSRQGCHLCEEAEAVIDRSAGREHLDVRVVNIEGDPELEARYGTEIPVVFLNGKKAFKYHVDGIELERKIRQLWNP